MSATQMRVVGFAIPAMLLLALAPLPHGFYVLLRWVVCISAVLFLVHLLNSGSPLVWVFGLVAVFFNPIVPVHLSRSAWLSIDVVTALLFAVASHENGLPASGGPPQ